ncbi:MAG: lipolytic protein g-d-s-l family [Clostridia bacterium]|jgi:lysophospholipase L1-like esterase|nr:lipolytic protein g-d-s-l family [Clostridia bacterium]
MYRLLPFLFLVYIINEYQNYSSPKYLALGDSLAVGIGAFWGCGYTRQYYKWLINTFSQRYFSYQNLGVIGWTSEALLNAVTLNTNYRRAISNAAIITIDIGGNDILKHKYSTDELYQALACFEHNLYTALYEIRCLNRHAQIYLMDIYNPYPAGHEIYEISEAWVKGFNSVIWSTLMHSEFKVTGIAGAYTAFKGNEYNYTFIKNNNVHPNTLGHKIICDCYKSTTVI